MDLDWNSILTALGPTGVLVWYLWHTQSVTLPRIDAARAEEARTSRAEFRATLDKIVTDFRADLASERAARAAEIESLREALSCPKEH